MGSKGSKPLSRPSRPDPHAATQRIETQNPRKIGPPPPPRSTDSPDLTGKK